MLNSWNSDFLFFLRVLATYTNIQIPTSLHPDGVNLWYFKLRLFYVTKFIVWNINRSTTLGCKDIGFRKSELVAKTRFISSEIEVCNSNFKNSANLYNYNLKIYKTYFMLCHIYLGNWKFKNGKLFINLSHEIEGGCVRRRGKESCGCE